VLIIYSTSLAIALEVDEKSLDVEMHSLMLVNYAFLRIPTFGVIPTTERLLSMPQITRGEKDFLKFLV